MNVLHVAPYFAPAWAFGGVPRAATDLARAQLEAGHDVRALTTDALTRASRLAAGDAIVGGVPVTRVPNTLVVLRSALNLSTPAGFRRAFERLSRTWPPDVVHCHELRTVENLCVTAARIPAAPAFVVSPHGTITYATGRTVAKRAWDHVFAARMLPRFTRVVALTSAEAEDVRALWAAHGVPLDDSSIAIVSNGVDADLFGRLPDRAAARRQIGVDGDPVVLFMGRLEKRKRLPFLVEAFAAATGNLPSARLVIAGPDEGDGGEMIRTAERLGIASKVVLPGFLADGARLAAYAAADVFALPALGEGFSLAVLEAMAAGLPVVLSRDCHFPEASDAGAGVTPGDSIEGWCETLRILLTDSNRRLAMGDQARALARSRYAWSAVAARMDVVYGAAVDSGRSAR